MANSVLVQLLEDGPRNVVAKVTGILDTADVTATDILDPATLTSMLPGGSFSGNALASQLAIVGISWDVQGALAVRLWWDATADVLIRTCTGQGEECYRKTQPLQNNAGAGKTGKIQLTTEGYTATSANEFTVILHCRKQGSLG